MSQKVNPIAVRLRFNRRSDSSWFSDYYYSTLLYQDLNFREYLSFRGTFAAQLLRAKHGPNANNLGPSGVALAKCVIHQFPKRSLIHLFCLGRPKVRRTAQLLLLRNLAKSVFEPRASISQKKKALACYVRQSYNFSKVSLNRLGVLHFASQTTAVAPLPAQPSMLSEVRPGTSVVFSGTFRKQESEVRQKAKVRSKQSGEAKVRLGTQWGKQSGPKRTFRKAESRFIANLLELHKTADLGEVALAKEATSEGSESVGSKKKLLSKGSEAISQVRLGVAQQNLKNAQQDVRSNSKKRLCLRRVIQLLTESGFTSGVLGSKKQHSTNQVASAKVALAKVPPGCVSKESSSKNRTSVVFSNEPADLRTFESSGEVRGTQLAKSTRLKSLVGALAFNYYAMHYFFLKKTNSIYEIASHQVAPARRTTFDTRIWRDLTSFAPNATVLKVAKQSVESSSLEKKLCAPRFEEQQRSRQCRNEAKWGKVRVLPRSAPLTRAFAAQPLGKSRYFYLSNVQSILSDKTKTFTSIRPIKVSSIFQSASLIAQEIACKLEQKKSFRQICRSIFQQISNCKYIKGIRISCSGRLNGAEIAKTECRKYGETSLHVFSDKIDYAQTKASTAYGILGVKVWISYV